MAAILGFSWSLRVELVLPGGSPKLRQPTPESWNTAPSNSLTSTVPSKELANQLSWLIG